MERNKVVIKKIITIVIIIVLMILLAFIYNKMLNRNNEQPKDMLQEIFANVEKNNTATLALYTIYGNHLNVDGYIPSNLISDAQINNIKLIIRDINNNEIEYPLNYSLKDENYIFNLSENINEGINLEKLSSNKYFVFLKVVQQIEENEQSKYFSINNISQYKENEYYTLTNNFENRKINIFSKNYEYEEEKEPLKYMQIKVADTTLPVNVYDIVIDAGHGGRDPGAMHNGKEEADITLEYSMKLKSKLESLGYKVKLTREKDEYIDSYGDHGRATTGYEVKAKLVLSIHLNSTLIQNPQGGVEIYAPNNANLNFAKSFANNIVSYTGTRYSPNNIAKALDGVYVRTYTEQEVQDAIVYANDLGYKPYESLSTQTPYLFMIRETGGIMTRAYIDGRNKNLESNPYINSNIAPEAYLLELGFINCQNDIDNLLKNQDNYINAIVDSIVNNYK